MSDSLQPHGLQHTKLPCPSPSPGVCSNSCPLSRWCHPTTSSCHSLLLPSVFHSIRVFSNELALRIRWQHIGASASASVLPMNIQDWFSLGLTGSISSQSRRLLKVFSSTTVQKHQFFGTQHSLTLTSTHDYWKNHSFTSTDLNCQGSPLQPRVIQP